MRNFKLLFLLMTLIALGFTGCKDDDDDDNAAPSGSEYTMETMSGTFENVAERIKVELNSDGTAILTKVEGDYPGQDEEVDNAATWAIQNYEAPAGVSTEDEPLSIVIEHVNSEFDQPYVLIINSTDEVKDHWQKTLTRTVDDGGGDDGDEFTMETMSGTFENEAERIKVELSTDGTAILTKVEGEYPGQDEEIDNAATWTIQNYEAPMGVSTEDEPLSIVIEHANSEFDQPYVLIINSTDEVKDHWQKILTRTGDGGGGDDNPNLNSVSDVKVVQLDDGVVWLTWTNPADYNSIEIFNGEMVEGSNDNRVGLVEGEGDNDYKVTGLNNGTEYTFYIYASKFGEGYSEAVTITATPEDEGLSLEAEDLPGTFWEYQTFSTHKRIEFINETTVKYYEGYGTDNQTEENWTYNGQEGSMYYSGRFYNATSIEQGEFKITVYDLTFDDTYSRVAQ